MKQCMKRALIFISVLSTTAIMLPHHAAAQDPISLIIKEGVKKIIVAVDLKIQRLQTKTIWLQHAQKVVENTMSKLKLDEITNWVQKQKDLYQKYFDELAQVRTALLYYHRIRELTNQQIAMVKQYKQAWNQIRQDKHFTTAEVFYIGQVYTGILQESLKNLDQLSLVIHSFTTKMSDAARLDFINRTADAMQQNYKDLNDFTTQNAQLSLARSVDEHDIAVVKELYGIR